MGAYACRAQSKDPGAYKKRLCSGTGRRGGGITSLKKGRTLESGTGDDVIVGCRKRDREP